MEHIYIAMVDTPGVFAAVIRGFLKQKYIHVVIGMDAELEEAYSFGRRNPRVPFFAGFEREDKRKILRAFPTADYMVCELDCSMEQKEGIRERLRQDYQKRYRYHYAVPGLPFIVWGHPFYRKNQYTCSSYIARILQEHRICISGKHFSLVTPKDFFLYPDKRVVFEGSLAEFVRAEYGTDTAGETAGAAGHGAGLGRYLAGAVRHGAGLGRYLAGAAGHGADMGGHPAAAEEPAMQLAVPDIPDRKTRHGRHMAEKPHGMKTSERVVAVYGS